MPIIEDEQAKFAGLEAKAQRADKALETAKQQLIDAKVDGMAEAKQRPLLKAVIEATAEADACHAASATQAEALQALREEIERRNHDEIVNGHEADMAAARDAYGTAYRRFEESLRKAASAFTEMSQARAAERDAATRLVRFENKTTGLGVLGAVEGYARVPKPGNEQTEPGRRLRPPRPAGPRARPRRLSTQVSDAQMAWTSHYPRGDEARAARRPVARPTTSRPPRRPAPVAVLAAWGDDPQRHRAGERHGRPAAGPPDQRRGPLRGPHRDRLGRTPQTPQDGWQRGNGHPRRSTGSRPFITRQRMLWGLA